MLEGEMDNCTCNQAIPREEMGQLAFFDKKTGKIEGYRFDAKCPVHRIISAVNGVPVEVRQVEEKVVDKPLTAREKRQKARKAARA
jgi:hypothetical protein